MKKVILSAAAVVLAVMLVSCGSGGPKANAEKFLNAVYHLDYATAKEVATEDTRKQLSNFESIQATLATEELKKEVKKIEIEVKEPRITGDRATVEYILSIAPASPKTLKMVRQKDKWLAEFSKMDIGGLGGLGLVPGATDIPTGTSPDTLMAPPADGPPPPDDANTTKPNK
jgi:hypothetical protein